MDASNLTASQFVGVFCPYPSTERAVELMQQAFAKILNKDAGSIGYDYSITHTEPIHGLPFSSRLLLQHEHEGSSPVPEMISLEDMARDILTELIEQARFCEPLEKPGTEYHKGFEVLEVYIDGYPSILIRAVMVPFPRT